MTTDTSLTPQRFFAEKFGIAKGSLGRILGGMLGKAADDGDIYFEYLVGESISLEEHFAGGRRACDGGESHGLRLL